MSKLTILYACTLLTFGAGAAVAAPDDKAPNAAYPEKDTGCIVRGGADQGYAFDADCAVHFIWKYDENGARVSFRYQDKGTLQEGQLVPDSAVRTPVSLTIAGKLCTGYEVATPSGEYSSNLTCIY